MTQDATGREISTDKIVRFRNGIGDFPLIIGAGLTPQERGGEAGFGRRSHCGRLLWDNYQDNNDVYVPGPCGGDDGRSEKVQGEAVRLAFTWNLIRRVSTF